MAYILESKKEFERLERQAQNPAYDFRRELSGLVVPHRANILDAGCGSGVVTRYLATEYPQALIHGCELSTDRIEMAQKAAADLSNVSFTNASITKMPFEKSTFDVVISRYVFQHLTAKTITAALREFQRVMKPGAKLTVIDGDGLFVNLFPQSKTVTNALRKMSSSGMVDFSVGRKLPSLLVEAGFQEVAWKMETADHNMDSREAEVQLMRERFHVAAEKLSKLLGKKAAQKFADAYLKELAAPGSTYFTQTFVVTGTKSGSLKLVK